MGFTTSQALIDEAVTNGRTWETHWWKTGPVEAAGAAGKWFDMSSWGGNPRGNAYPGGLTANPLYYGSSNGAFYGGPPMAASYNNQYMSVNGSLQFVDSHSGFKIGGLQNGMTITVSGFNNSGNNGTFTISSVTTSTITVTNTTGMIAEPNASQNVTISTTSNYTKYLTKMMILSANANYTNSSLLLCDYLLFHNYFDMTVTDFQPVNSVMTLPRYPTGEGVQMFLVSTNDIGSNVVGLQVTYTNSLGIQNQLSQPVLFTPSTTTNVSNLPYTGIAIHGSLGAGVYGSVSSGPWIPLQAGDTGVQSIQGIQLNGSAGAGFAAIVLAYPLFHMQVRTLASPQEEEILIDCPVLAKIKDNAYLNFLVFPGAAVASGNILAGMFEFAWGNS
jgi:hypothetical protein